jgi:hypothetical protein
MRPVKRSNSIRDLKGFGNFGAPVSHPCRIGMVR